MQVPDLPHTLHCTLACFYYKIDHTRAEHLHLQATFLVYVSCTQTLFSPLSFMKLPVDSGVEEFLFLPAETGLFVPTVFGHLFPTPSDIFDGFVAKLAPSDSKVAKFFMPLQVTLGRLSSKVGIPTRLVCTSD